MSEKEIYWLDMWEDFLQNVNEVNIWADSFEGMKLCPICINIPESNLLKIGKEWVNLRVG